MHDDENFDDEVVEDVEIYDGLPDFSSSSEDPRFPQDDLPEDAALSFMPRISPVVNSTPDTLAWYRSHRTTSEIGFNPDGMCLKICRTARNIPALYRTAVEAQEATPDEYRVYEVRKLRKGMVVYYDDPNDSNRAGHVATVIGRVKGFDPDMLKDLLVETNSVKAGELVVVRGDYFTTFWDDPFQFGATILNGFNLPLVEKISKLEKFNNGGPVYNLKLLDKACKAGRNKACKVRDGIDAQVKRLPDSPKLARVREFKDEWRADRKIDMSLLNEAVQSGRVGRVKQVRDEIRRLIDVLPDE